MSISSMLMSLTWGDRFTSSAEGRQWRRALISCYRLAFTGSLRQSIQLLHITAEDESRGYIKKRKKIEQEGRVRKNRNDLGLAHSSLSGPSYLPLCPWAHHISSLMNSPIKRGSSISLSSFLSRGLPSPSCSSGRYQSLSFAVLGSSIRSADLLHIKDPFR